MTESQFAGLLFWVIVLGGLALVRYLYQKTSGENQNEPR